MTSAPARGATRRVSARRAPLLGTWAASALVALALAVPAIAQWHVHANAFAPLSANWRPRVGLGTPFALLVAAAAYRWAIPLARRLSWRRLLGASTVLSFAWLLALALVDGRAGHRRTAGLGWLQRLPVDRAARARHPGVPARVRRAHPARLGRRLADARGGSPAGRRAVLRPARPDRAGRWTRGGPGRHRRRRDGSRRRPGDPADARCRTGRATCRPVRGVRTRGDLVGGVGRRPVRRRPGVGAVRTGARRDGPRPGAVARLGGRRRRPVRPHADAVLRTLARQPPRRRRPGRRAVPGAPPCPPLSPRSAWSAHSRPAGSCGGGRCRCCTTATTQAWRACGRRRTGCGRTSPRS